MKTWTFCILLLGLFIFNDTFLELLRVFFFLLVFAECMMHILMKWIQITHFYRRRKRTFLLWRTWIDFYLFAATRYYESCCSACRYCHIVDVTNLLACGCNFFVVLSPSIIRHRPGVIWIHLSKSAFPIIIIFKDTFEICLNEKILIYLNSWH